TLLSCGDRAPSDRIMGDSLSVRVEFDAPGIPIKPVLGVVLKTALGTPVFGINNRIITAMQPEVAISSGPVECRFEPATGMPGRYLIDLYFGDMYRDLDIVPDAASFQVQAVDVFGTGYIPPSSAGPIFWPAVFSITERTPCSELCANS